MTDTTPATTQKEGFDPTATKMAANASARGEAKEQSPSAPPARPDVLAWMNYEFHPDANIFPLLNQDSAEFIALKEDIKENGLRQSITLHEGKILDGRNRHNACKALFLPPTFEDLPKGKDPLDYVISANLHRRHLNESQRAAIAAGLVNSKLGYNQYNRATVTNGEAAKLLGVSEATVKMAKKVATDAAPEIVELVRKGELRLGAAMPLLNVAKEQQTSALKKAKAEAEAAKAKAKAEADAARAAVKAGKPAPVPASNQALVDLDTFKAKWSAFNEMQRKAFVMAFEDELAGLLEYVRQQKAMAGGATTNQGS